MSDCDLITEQRINGLLCRSMHCEPCTEFRELNDDYLIRKKKELSLIEQIQSLKQDRAKLASLLERFCTKSNGISVFARANWKCVERHKKDVMFMYDFQCECEEYLSTLKDLGEE